MTLRVGVLGHGAIGRVVAAELAAGAVAGAELSGVVSHSAVEDVPACTLPELLRGSDVVVEAAGQQAVREYGRRVLEAGVDLVVVSVGALADPDLARVLTAHAPGRTFYTTGAIGGLDLLSAARRQAPFEHVRLTTTKKPVTLTQPWMDPTTVQRLRTTTDAFDVYRSTAREVAGKFPKSTNVAACLALAAGTWDVEVVVRADPKAALTSHVIDAAGPYGHYHFEICNAPDEQNPATSKIVPHAVLRTIATLAQAGDQIV